MTIGENQNVTVSKEDAQPQWVFVGFVMLGLATLLVVAWLGFGLFAETWPQLPAKPNTTMEDMRNYFWSVGVVAAGIIGVWGFALAAVRTKALDRQAKTAETDSKFSEKKHASEAFATAIEQLGSKNFAVRLGAVYALEALAKSSQDLHGPIFETLCAYVRQEAPAPTDDDLSAKIEARGKDNIYQVIYEHLKTVTKPDVVVQAILTVIGRRDPARDPEGFRLDLQETDLRKADMRNGHFERTILSSTYLSRTRLDGAHLERTDLSGACLQGSNLQHARLQGANFSFTQVEAAHLNNANLEGTDLSFSILESAGLKDISFNEETNVGSAVFREVRGIPATPENDFRATVQGADTATWPDDDDEAG